MSCRDAVYSNDYYNFIIRNSAYLTGYEPGECHIDLDSLYTIEFAQREGLPPLSLGNYTYASIPKCYALLGEEALEATGIPDVRDLPSLALEGNRILIGFVDTGINYQLPAFLDEAGESRIVALWDQTGDADGTDTGSGNLPGSPESRNLQGNAELGNLPISPGPANPRENTALGVLPPYGTVYTREEINRALAQENPLEVVPSADENGHGSYVASVAAGSIVENGRFSGGAPKADIAVVKLKEAKQYLREFYFIREDTPVFQEDDIMAGVAWLDALAAERNQPLVICIALGTASGSHSGNSALAAYLDNLAVRFRRCVVTATGNEAANRHHFYGRFPVEVSSSRPGTTQTGPEDYVEVELMVGEGVAGFTMEQWALAPLLYEVSLISPTGETVPRIPSQQAKSRELQFLFENTRIELDYATPEGATGNQLIFFRFVAPAPGIWRIRVYLLQGTSGMFQMYLPMEEMLTGEVYFLSSNPDTTILGPGNALRVITVGGYNDANGSIYLASGRGYTLEGNVKPDFVAPAVEVTGVNTSGDGRAAAARPTATQYAPRTGTSAAAAFAAAAAALYMEWDILGRGNVTASTVQVKNFLLRGTRQSENELYPNRQWGNGILDIYQAFRNLRL